MSLKNNPKNSSKMHQVPPYHETAIVLLVKLKEICGFEKAGLSNPVSMNPETFSEYPAISVMHLRAVLAVWEIHLIASY